MRLCQTDLEKYLKLLTVTGIMKNMIHDEFLAQDGRVMDSMLQ